MYVWNGETVHDNEDLVIAKSVFGRFPEIEQASLVGKSEKSDAFIEGH